MKRDAPDEFQKNTKKFNNSAQYFHFVKTHTPVYIWPDI